MNKQLDNFGWIALSLGFGFLAGLHGDVTSHSQNIIGIVVGFSGLGILLIQFCSNFKIVKRVEKK